MAHDLDNRFQIRSIHVQTGSEHVPAIMKSKTDSFALFFFHQTGFVYRRPECVGQGPDTASNVVSTLSGFAWLL
jgi:hypothetical protein